MSPRALSNPFAATRLGGFLPFVWYGTRFGDWLRLLASGRFKVTLNRLPNIIGVTLTSPISSGIFHLSEALFRKRAAAVEITAPIFVLGHWRSGTTLLHNLLTRDPGAAYPNTFECAFPGGFLLSERLLGWSLTPFLPRRRPIDDVPVARDLPFEDEFALAKIGAGSPYESFAFPRQPGTGDRYLDLADLTDAERGRWEESFLWLMRRFQLAYPGKRLILKSPPHTARIATLLKLFPDARFIHISRNPYSIYPSTLWLWKVLNSRFGLQNPANDDGWLPEHVLATFVRMYAAYVRDRDLVPAGRLAEIRYEDLAAAPKATVRDIYARLGLGDFAPAGRAIDQYLAGLGEHRQGEYGLGERERRAISDRWGFYFDRFGYDREYRSARGQQSGRAEESQPHARARAEGRA